MSHTTCYTLNGLDSLGLADPYEGKVLTVTGLSRPDLSPECISLALQNADNGDPRFAGRPVDVTSLCTYNAKTKRYEPAAVWPKIVGPLAVVGTVALVVKFWPQIKQRL